FDFLEFRTLYDRLLEALGAAADEGAPAGPAGDVLEAERSDLTDAASAAGCLRALAEGDALLAVAAAWRGAEGRSPLEGLALVTDAASGDVAWIPAATLALPDVAAALAELVGPGGR